jgi:mono/diheme cytochrome c family protein
MSRSARVVVVILAAAVAVLAAAMVLVATRSRWQRAALDTPIQRGRLLAEKMGCFGCHGPGGGQPIPNEGARDGEVPAWTGGTWAAWNRDEDDVRSWILKGRTSRRGPDAGALIPMPPYENRLTPKETDALVAYVLAVSNFGRMTDAAAAAGREVAYRLGCFGCHGDEGRGLVMNPGSFKGYIPPWDGDDYPELVRDDTELRQWVRDGICERLHENPAARRILEAQTIAMPAYRTIVSDDDLKAIAAYIAWVRAHPRTGVPEPGKPPAVVP